MNYAVILEWQACEEDSEHFRVKITDFKSKRTFLRHNKKELQGEKVIHFEELDFMYEPLTRALCDMNSLDSSSYQDWLENLILCSFCAGVRHEKSRKKKGKM